MKVFTLSEARRRLSRVLDAAREGEVLISRRGGESYSLTFNEKTKSPFDVPGITTSATLQDILAAVSESRSREPEGR